MKGRLIALAARGYTNAQIVRQLFISVRTVLQAAMGYALASALRQAH